MQRPGPMRQKSGPRTRCSSARMRAARAGIAACAVTAGSRWRRPSTPRVPTRRDVTRSRYRCEASPCATSSSCAYLDRPRVSLHRARWARCPRAGVRGRPPDAARHLLQGDGRSAGRGHVQPVERHPRSVARPQQRVHDILVASAPARSGAAGIRGSRGNRGRRPVVSAAVGGVPDVHRHDIATAAGGLRDRQPRDPVQDPGLHHQRGRSGLSAARQAAVRTARRGRRRQGRGRTRSGLGGARTTAPYTPSLG